MSMAFINDVVDVNALGLGGLLSGEHEEVLDRTPYPEHAVFYAL